MTKLKSPLLSMEAHGTLADTLTFRSRGTRAHVFKKRDHADAGTQAQLNHRAHFRDAASLWRIMTDADRHTFAQNYQLPNLAPFAVWLQYIIKRETVHPNWMHPLHAGHDQAIAPFYFILPNEVQFGPFTLDISGNNRHQGMAGASLVQGDRDQAIYTDENRTSEACLNSIGLGDMTEFTFGYLYLPDTAQGDGPDNQRHLWARSDGTESGQSITMQRTHSHYVINGGGPPNDLTSYALWTVGKWNSYLYRFDGTDSGRMQIWLNGGLAAERTTSATFMKSNSHAYSIQNDPWDIYSYGTFDLTFLYGGATNARII